MFDVAFVVFSVPFELATRQIRMLYYKYKTLILHENCVLLYASTIGCLYESDFITFFILNSLKVL